MGELKHTRWVTELRTVRPVAGGNSAGSVPEVVELAPVFGNGGASLAAAAARPYPTPRVDVARTISVTPRPAFSLHVWEVRVRS